MELFNRLDINIKTEDRERKTASLIFWSVVLMIMLLRAFPFGLRYFPVVDDNNMYGVFYRLPAEKVVEIFNSSLKTRPLAWLCDIFVTSRLWGTPWITLLVFTLMQFCIIRLFYSIMDRLRMPVGVLAVMFLVLNPYGLEATWWQAAASRIVVGLFFTSVSIFCLLKGITAAVGSRRAYAYGIAFSVLNILSYGFYEQITIMSFVCAVLIILFFYDETAAEGTRFFKRMKQLLLKSVKKRLHWVAIPLINLSLILTYYFINRKGGNQEQRGAIVATDVAPHFFTAILRHAYKLGYDMPRYIILAAKEGAEAAWLHREYYFVMLLLIFIVGVIVIIRFNATRDGEYAPIPEDVMLFGEGCPYDNYYLRILIAIVLILAPYSVFFILQTGYIAPRNLYASFFGIALLIDTLGQYSAKFYIGSITFIAELICTIALCIVFMAGSLNFVSCCKTIYETDEAFVREFDSLQKKTPEKRMDNVLLLNAKPRYFENDGCKLNNCTTTEWALIGKLMAKGIAVPWEITLTTDEESLPADSISDILEEYEALLKTLDNTNESGKGTQGGGNTAVAAAGTGEAKQAKKAVLIAINNDMVPERIRVGGPAAASELKRLLPHIGAEVKQVIPMVSISTEALTGYMEVKGLSMTYIPLQ